MFEKRSVDWVLFLERYGGLLFLIILIVFFYSQNQFFLSVRNIKNILSEVSVYGIIAMGMTFVILTSGVDLSVGSLLAFASISGAALVTNFDIEGSAIWMLALGASLILGSAAGYIQGRSVVSLSVPPFIVTLGGMTIWRGVALIVNDGSPISISDPVFRWFGRGEILFLPVPVWFFIAVAVLAFVIQRYTRFGRQIFAVGGNMEAAHLCGINVNRVLVSVYVIMGFLAGLAGFLLSARLSTAEAVAGLGYELRVIASVVIGGTSLFGGLGGVGGTIIGVLLIGVLLNGLVFMNVSAYYQQVVIGVIIVLAVAFDMYAKRRSS